MRLMLTLAALLTSLPALAHSRTARFWVTTQVSIGCSIQATGTQCAAGLEARIATHFVEQRRVIDF